MVAELGELFFRMMRFQLVVVAGFEVMVVVARNVRKDEFEANFDDNDRDKDADIGFEIDLPDHINNR